MSLKDEIDTLSSYVKQAWTKINDKRPVIAQSYRKKNLSALVEVLDEILKEEEPIIVIPENYSNCYCFDKGLIESQLKGRMTSIWDTTDMKKILTEVHLNDVSSLDGFRMTSYGQISSLELNGVYAADSQIVNKCEKLSRIQMDNLSACGNNTFKTDSGKTSISHINVPNLKYAGYGIFKNLTSLTSVNVASMEYIGYSPFSNCSKIKKIEFPSLKVIPSNKRIYVRSGGVEITGDDHVNKSYQGFGDCGELLSVYMPNVTEIMFGGEDCNKLEYIDMSSEDLRVFDKLTITNHPGTNLSINMKGLMKNVTSSTVSEFKNIVQDIKLGNIKVTTNLTNIQTVKIICNDAGTANFLNNLDNLRIISNSWRTAFKDGKIRFVT